MRITFLHYATVARTTIMLITYACGGTRHVNKKRRHNLNTHMHAGTTPRIRILAISKTMYIILPEDGPMGLKHVGVNDEML